MIDGPNLALCRVFQLLLVSMLVPTMVFAAEPQRIAEHVEVDILSSNLANGNTVGEWGFSALVKVDGHCVLFDAGRHPDTVIRNAAALKVDLSCVTDVVLSHFHFDHTTGLPPLVTDLRKRNSASVQRVHVAAGIFLPRRIKNAADSTEANGMIAMRDSLETRGVEFIEYEHAAEILPAVWVTGPVERTHSEKTYPRTIEVKLEGSWTVDHVPESQGLVIVTQQGPIVLLGCGHSGSVNLLEQVRRDVQDHAIHALMGGMHLYAADDNVLNWTAEKLRKIGLQHLMAGHCTGIEPLYRLRAGLNLTRQTAVVGAVGSRFVLGEGIHPTAIAK